MDDFMNFVGVFIICIFFMFIFGCLFMKGVMKLLEIPIIYAIANGTGDAIINFFQWLITN